MQLNFSPGALINAGGALLFLLVGIAILAIARQTRLGLRFGAFAATFGLAYVIENLVDYDVDPVSALILLVAALAAATCLGFLIAAVVRGLPRPGRPKIGLLATGIGLAVVVALIVLGQRQLQGPGLISKVGSNSVGALPLTFLVQPFLLVLLAASSQIPSGGSLHLYKGRLLLGLSAGLFAVNIDMVGAASSSPDRTWTGPAIDGVGLLIGAMLVYTAWIVLRSRPAGGERLARRAFGAIVIVGLAGCLQEVFLKETAAIGPYGIIRSVGAVLLVLAVVKYDLLAVPVPRLVARRGALAGAALAILFIVAQVAQNFLAAQYGLLMGGVVAGTMLFAASPIQRAMERHSSGSPRPLGRASNAAENERVYRVTLVKYLADGAVSKDEELALAHLVDTLGLTARRAMEIRQEAERTEAA